MELFVDGDHSGGQYACGPIEGTLEQIRLFVGSQAQRWAIVSQAPDAILHGVGSFADSWARFPPWADVWVRQIGVEPTQTRIELSLTPWDILNWNGPEVSVPSVLEAGRTIGILELGREEES